MITSLLKDKWVFVPNGIYSVIGDSSCTKAFTECVGGKAIHLHFDVTTNSLLGQELTRNDLQFQIDKLRSHRSVESKMIKSTKIFLQNSI